MIDEIGVIRRHKGLGLFRVAGFGKWARRSTSLLVLWLGVFGGGQSAAWARHADVELDLNQQETLDLGPYRNIYAGDRNIVSVRALPGQSQVILTGVGEGSTSITVLFADGRTETRHVRVVSRRIDAEELRLLIGDIFGVEIVQVGSTLAVKGAIRTQSELRRYHLVVQRFSNVLDLVEDLTSGRNVRLDVKVFEVTRSGARSLGIEWFETVDQLQVDRSGADERGLNYALSPPSGGALYGEETLPDLQHPASIGHLGRLTPVLVELRALEERGQARLLAKPQLVAENNHRAKFLVGGRIPYSVANGLGNATVEFQEYGTILEMEPNIISATQLALSITAEVSEPDYANVVLGVPGIKERSAVTQVQLADGETIAIAGFVSTSESTSRRSLPIPVVASIPILGSLFGADVRQVDEIETLIFVTPHILAAGRSGIGTLGMEQARADMQRMSETTWVDDENSVSDQTPDVPEGW